MLINKKTHVEEREMFECVVKNYNEILTRFKELRVSEMSLKQACQLFSGYNFTHNHLFDFDATWFIGTIIQMDGYLELSNYVEVYDFNGDIMGQYDINELVKFI